MKSQYRRVDLRTIKGIKQAEKLHANGWKIASSSFDTIDFYKPMKKTNKG